MTANGYRHQLAEYIAINANPPDKLSHQARLYQLAVAIAQGEQYDDEVVYAAAWLHDLGVFIGHRPQDPEALAAWDCVAYAMEKAPALLQRFGFPPQKTATVIEIIRTHQPQCTPVSFEAALIRDADILEQLGAVGILRIVSKVGRDTRFRLFSDALLALKKNLQYLPGQLRLERAREMAQPRILALQAFLAAAETEAQNLPW